MNGIFRLASQYAVISTLYKVLGVSGNVYHNPLDVRPLNSSMIR